MNSSLALHAAADHDVFQHIQCREQRRQTMTLVVLRHGVPQRPGLSGSPDCVSRYDELENVVIAFLECRHWSKFLEGTGAGARSHERYPEAALEITDEALHLPLVHTMTADLRISVSTRSSSQNST